MITYTCPVTVARVIDAAVPGPAQPRVDGRVVFDRAPAAGGLAEDVRAGLSGPRRRLPPKHGYDARGSQLLEAIHELPEYYLPRAERAVLARCAPAIVAASQPSVLVELGAGAADRTDLLLDAMAADRTPVTYVPIDVSETALAEAARRLTGAYVALRVHAIVGDFERDLDRVPAGPPRLVAILGSTVGNFDRAGRIALLATARRLLRDGDRLVVGIDLVKDVRVLEAAYRDDEQGLAREFNRNLLHVVNRGLGADFRPEAFDHVAPWDHEHAHIDRRLRARTASTVSIPALGLRVRFEPGDDIRTGVSAKFTLARFADELAQAGLRATAAYGDATQRVAVVTATRDTT
jgi:L-histidine Nalpha-methyltransferase